MPGRSVRVALIAALCGAFAAPQGAQAWNAPGHQAIALAGFERLDADTRRLVLADLSAHPRFQADIATLAQDDLGAGALFAAAATWPDVARGFQHLSWWRGWQRAGLVERFHRGRWHYVNFAVYLTPADANLAIADPAPRQDFRSADAQPRHILEALALARATLAAGNDGAAAATQRGLMLAWALHLIGDSHQPLHAVALFSRTRWPRGDRGGNDVTVSVPGFAGPLTLHYFWDQALLAAADPARLRALARRLVRAQSAVGVDTRPVVWLRESARAGEHSVYGPLREQLVRSPSVRLDDAYVARARSTAQARGALAAARTAAWLQDAYRARTMGAGRE
ncbi:MAG: S1/P1 nuclease [Pseudomonadota bacterium]